MRVRNLCRAGACSKKLIIRPFNDRLHPSPQVLPELLYVLCARKSTRHTDDRDLVGFHVATSAPRCAPRRRCARLFAKAEGSGAPAMWAASNATVGNWNRSTREISM